MLFHWQKRTASNAKEQGVLRRDGAEVPPLERSEGSFDNSDIWREKLIGFDKNGRFESSREPASIGDHLHGFEGPSPV